MIQYLTVIPAYGRDYKSIRDVKSAWEAGEDFIEASSRRYCSKRDLEAMADGKFVVMARYAKLTKITEVGRS